MMVSVDRKRLVFFAVEKNSFSSYLSHEVTTMWSITKISCCKMLINNLVSHTPYLGVFVWWYWYMPEEVSNINKKIIIIFEGDQNGILICKAPTFLLVDWVYYKSSCNISQCIISDFSFPIDWRCITMMLMLWHVLINY